MHSMQVMKVIQVMHKLQVMRAMQVRKVMKVMKVMKVREGLKKWFFFMAFVGRGGGVVSSAIEVFFKYCFSSHAELFMASKNMFST